MLALPAVRHRYSAPSADRNVCDASPHKPNLRSTVVKALEHTGKPKYLSRIKRGYRYTECSKYQETKFGKKYPANRPTISHQKVSPCVFPFSIHQMAKTSRLATLSDPFSQGRNMGGEEHLKRSGQEGKVRQRYPNRMPNFPFLSADSSIPPLALLVIQPR